MEYYTMQNINDFKKSLKFTLKWEGGYSNDPKDPGGETKYGISKRAYPDIDIAGLTVESASLIYARDYWDACGCDDILYPLNAVIFDTAVNCGVRRATEWARGCDDPIVYLQKRRDHYVALINKNTSLMRFAKGWWNRLADLRKLVDVSQA